MSRSRERNRISLPIADCENCLWLGFDHEGGHCYMFRDPPPYGFCAQFNEKPQEPQDASKDQ